MRTSSAIVVALLVSAAIVPTVAWAEGGGTPGQPGAGQAPPEGQGTGFVQQPAAPPPPDGQQPQQPQPPPQQQRVNNRRGFDTNLQVGIGLPVMGPLAQTGSWGGFVSGFAGWEVPGGLAGIVEVGGRYHYAGFQNSAEANPGRGFGDIYIGAGGRYTPLREYVFHPFVQATISLHYVGAASLTGSQGIFRNGVVTFGATALVGGEIDVHESFSLEFGVRWDWMLSTAAWARGTSGVGAPSPVDPASDMLLTPFLGGTIYY